MAQVHPPVSPSMSTLTFYIGMRHFHPLQFLQVLLVGLVEKVRFADGDPVQFVPIVLLGLQGLVEIAVHATGSVFSRHDGGGKQADVIKGIGVVAGDV